jgi:DnaK suppressor protein
LNQQEIEQFKQDLLKVRAALQALSATLAESGKTVELDQTRVGRLSRMDAMQGQQMALEAGRRHKQKLRDIGAALRRIDDGVFGLCLDCDEEINVRRLQADPSHAKCINCAD